MSKKIKGRTTEANELLTDYATIYTGFGKLMKKGYAQVETKINWQNKLSKVGYIHTYEIRAAMRLLPSYFEKES